MNEQKYSALKIVFASAFALIAGYSVYASQQKVEMSDLAMANVEALAPEKEALQCNVPEKKVECARVIMCNEIHLYYQQK